MTGFVSRPFELAISGADAPAVTFKMMLYAMALKEGRGGQSFKMSRGQGSMQLKCEHDLSGPIPCKVALAISLGNKSCETARRVVLHDFSQSVGCTAPDWDFANAVDKASQTFHVHVEVLGSY